MAVLALSKEELDNAFSEIENILTEYHIMKINKTLTNILVCAE